MSSKVFLPTKQLAELDVSDCNLKTIWNEPLDMAGYQPKNLLKNLKSLNVSNNEIAHVRQADLLALERLSVFDVSNNKLSCDREFRDLMKWLEKKKVCWQSRKKKKRIAQIEYVINVLSPHSFADCRR